MCGRFVLAAPGEALAALLGLDEIGPYAPRYNVAPTQPVLVGRIAESRREATHLRWGLIPSWSKDPAKGPLLINARAETLAEKPSFKNAFKRRRCLVPATGWYEWRKTEAGKQPHHLHRPGGEVLAFAGLYEHWSSPEGAELETLAIVTCPAAPELRWLHERMPLVLDPAHHEAWLDPSLEGARLGEEVFRPFEPETLVAERVSKRVNAPTNEGPELLEPLRADDAKE